MQIRPAMLLTLGLLAGLTPFAIDLYLPALPAIARDLGSSIEIAQLSVTVYLGVFAAAQLFLGPLSDVLGRRVTIGGGLLIFSLGTLGAILADSMHVLLIARALQALGGAAVAVTVPALVRDVYERDDYARVMSMVMLVMAMAPMVAPSVGGVIVSHAHWHWVFGALLLIALVTSTLFAWQISETLPRDRRHPPELARVLRNYLTLFRHPVGLGYLLTGALSFGGMMSFIVTSPYVYIELHGVSPGLFGLLFAFNVGLAMLGNVLNARLVKRIGSERLLRFGLGVQLAAGVMAFGLAMGPPPALWVIVLTLGIYLCVAGLVLGNSMAGFMGLFPHMAGTASALAGASRFGIGAVAGSLVSLLHDGSARPLLVAIGLCALSAWISHRALCCAQGREQPPAAPG